MGVFERFGSLTKALRGVQASGINPFGTQFDTVVSPTEAIVDGRKVTLVGTNNYLGLTFDETCVEAGIQALRENGTGTTGSRVANGTYNGHAALERALADFYGYEHGMVFSTGFQANLGVISTVAGPDDILLIDSDSHASVYDACQLSHAEVLRFRHNSASDLDHRLMRLQDRPGNKVVVVEGVYSMLGDMAPLAEIVEVVKKHGAYIVVDEAHSLGVLGENGEGLVADRGLLDQVDFIVGTFSKSLGAVGGFCVSSHPDFEVMRVACRPYMFSASLPPSVIATVLAALGEIRTRPELRVRLWRNIDVLYDGLARAGFLLGPEKSPIVSVHLPNRELAIDTWAHLLQAGYYVNVALSPATPGGVSLLRCSVSAAHRPEQLQGLVDTLIAVALENGALEPLAQASVG